jgi:hypothetical protein
VVAPPIRTAAITANEDFFNGIGQNREHLTSEHKLPLSAESGPSELS